MIAQGLVAYLSGLLFAAGLALASMTSPDKILRFLDVTHWDPSLMLVMAGALAVFAAGFRLVTQRAKPLLAPRFELPTRSQVDRTLVIGAVLFGIGWALLTIHWPSGCPRIPRGHAPRHASHRAAGG
jgi:uncharacterized membrane protein YedE/YeeE